MRHNSLSPLAACQSAKSAPQQPSKGHSRQEKENDQPRLPDDLSATFFSPYQGSG